MIDRNTIQLIYEVRRAASAASCTFFAEIIARGRKKTAAVLRKHSAVFGREKQ